MHINKFYQCLVHYLSNLTMHLLLLSQNFEVLMFDMVGQKFLAILNYVILLLLLYNRNLSFSMLIYYIFRYI